MKLWHAYAVLSVVMLGAVWWFGTPTYRTSAPCPELAFAVGKCP